MGRSAGRWVINSFWLSFIYLTFEIVRRTQVLDCAWASRLWPTTLLETGYAETDGDLIGGTNISLQGSKGRTGFVIVVKLEELAPSDRESKMGILNYTNTIKILGREPGLEKDKYTSIPLLISLSVTNIYPAMYRLQLVWYTTKQIWPMHHPRKTAVVVPRWPAACSWERCEATFVFRVCIAELLWGWNTIVSHFCP